MAVTDTHEPRWRGVNLEQLLMEHLDDEWLLLDRRSRQTHLLPNIAAPALFILCKEPQDVPGLIERLGLLCEDALSADARDEIDNLIQQFAQLGWVEETDG